MDLSTQLEIELEWKCAISLCIDQNVLCYQISFLIVERGQTNHFLLFILRILENACEFCSSVFALKRDKAPYYVKTLLLKPTIS